MAGTVKKILDFVIATKELLSLLFSPVPVIWAYVGGMMEGLPPLLRLVFILLILAMTFYVIYHFLMILDYGFGKYGDRKDRNDAADRLQDMLDTGSEALSINDVAVIWSDENKSKIHIFNPRLRRLKQAANNGSIKRHNHDGALPSVINKSTLIDLESTIEALKKGDI